MAIVLVGNNGEDNGDWLGGKDNSSEQPDHGGLHLA